MSHAQESSESCKEDNIRVQCTVTNPRPDACRVIEYMNNWISAYSTLIYVRKEHCSIKTSLCLFDIQIIHIYENH